MFNILYGAATALVGVKITETTISKISEGTKVDESGEEHKPDYITNGIFVVAGAALIVKGAKLIIDEFVSN